MMWSKGCSTSVTKYGQAEFVHVSERVFEEACDATGLVADKVPCLYGLNPLKPSWRRVRSDLVGRETQWP